MWRRRGRFELPVRREYLTIFIRIVLQASKSLFLTEITYQTGRRIFSFTFKGVVYLETLPFGRTVAKIKNLQN